MLVSRVLPTIRTRLQDSRKALLLTQLGLLPTTAGSTSCIAEQKGTSHTTKLPGLRI
jgi:hypothetical protein